MLFWGRKPPA